MSAHTAERARRYTNSLQPGLLSIITAVWDGSPIPYLRALATSIARQIESMEAEWVIVVNGCSRPQLLAYLQELTQYPFVSMHWLPQNAGIVRGLRQGLERATGRYLLPVDADDCLYPDALRIITAHVQANAYPTLLYTDEDKVSSSGALQPYFKPDWDPVLLANSAYIAHLGVIDRKSALDLSAYTDEFTEGSADWDLFTRFANAGQAAIHIPEIVYSWRIHAHSTADDAATKPYIRSSQEAVLRRFLASRPAGVNFTVEPSPLFGATAAHLRLVRRQVSPPALHLLYDVLSLSSLVAPAQALAYQDGFVGIITSDVAIDPAFADWHWDAVGLFELFPDTTAVGGRITNSAGVVVDGARCFGFGDFCGCPDAGRNLSDPGYFGLMWKQRTVSAIDASISLIRATDLTRVLANLPSEATLQNLGSWIAADALRHGRRVIYSPFLHAVEKRPRPSQVSDAEVNAFRSRCADILPDRRFYPKPFSLVSGYEISVEASESTDKPKPNDHQKASRGTRP